MSLKWPQNGINFTPAYQISGMPFVTSSNPAGITDADGTVKIEFPYVTSAFAVGAMGVGGSGYVNVGFTQNGVEDEENSFTVPAPNGSPVTSPQLRIRCKEIWLKAGTAQPVTFFVYAQLTNIDARQFPILTGSDNPSGHEIYWDGIG